jgi:hypothetical protein
MLKKKIINFEEDILSISSGLEASTITMITPIEGEVDLNAAYEALCILYPKNTDGTRFVHPEKTRNKIPYFGVSNVIVCIKYKGKVRGIRQNTGQMNNVVSIDLQCCNKNINLKLSRTGIQLTGASSEEMGNEAFEILCTHLNMIQDNIKLKNSLSEEIKKETVDWITGNPSLNMENFENPPEKINKELVSMLSGYFSEFDKYEDFCEKVHKVMNINHLCTDNVKPLTSNISNSVYNYTLGKEISLLKMTNHLYSKGFNVSFHNWNCTYLNVSIPIFNSSSSSSPHSMASSSTLKTESSADTKELEDLSDDEEETTTIASKKPNKIKAHRFIIYRKGSIKQTSPTTFTQALEIRNTLLESISDFKF